jgi:hypothetical protein
MSHRFLLRHSGHNAMDLLSRAGISCHPRGAMPSRRGAEAPHVEQNTRFRSCERDSSLSVVFLGASRILDAPEDLGDVIADGFGVVCQNDHVIALAGA